MAAPVSVGSQGNTLRAGSLRIHPSLGVARVGNDLTSFFIGPEIPGKGAVGQDGGKGTPVTSGPFSGYKTGLDKIKRQGQRFRVFIDVPGKPTEEVTLDTAGVTKIEWSVHLANKKAAFHEFNGQSGHDAAKVYNPIEPLRNNGKPRSQTVIDPGKPQTIDGRGQGPKKIDSSSMPGGSWPKDAAGVVVIDMLGELHTDDKGRLIVLGGSGEAKRFTAGATIGQYANNDGWLDSVSDGVVKATVTTKVGGKEVKVEAVEAWIFVGPPDFAPEIGNVVTLYDTLWNTAAQSSSIPIPNNNPMYTREPLKRLVTYKTNKAAFKPELNLDIAPLLKNTFNVKWVFGPAFDASAHSTANPPNPGTAPSLKSMLRPAAGGTAEVGPGSMPLLLGDENGNGSPRGYLSLTQVQLENIDHFGNNRFDTLPVPTGITPEGLDRAAMESCVGGAFFPGIEVSWMIRNPNVFSEPFRLKKLGTVLNAGMTPPLKIEPGLFSQQMALPWQADFYACTKTDVVPRPSSLPPRFFGWWPAQRPDDVRIGASSFEWGRGVAPGQAGMLDLVDKWKERGFVVPVGAGFEEQGGPKITTDVKVRFIQVEVLDDSDTFSTAEWTVQASCNVGSGPIVVALMTNQTVSDGQIIPLTQERTLTIPSRGELVVATRGTDEEGTFDESLGSASGRFNAGSSPAFGAGRQVLTTSNYKLTFDITIIP